MYLIFESVRMVQKIITNSGTPFAVAPSANHTDGSWTPAHLYDGEFGVMSSANPQLALRISGTIYYIPLASSSGAVFTNYANKALSNLTTTSINIALLAQTGIDLGSTVAPFRDLYIVGGGTYGTNYYKFTGTPTGARVITIPDVSDTIVTLNATQTLTNKSIVASQLTGLVALANGGTGAALVDPNADRILFWDDSAGAVDWLSVDSGLSIAGTILSGQGYALTIHASAQTTTTDAQTIYFGGLSDLAPGTTAALAPIYIPKTGTIKAIYLFSQAVTAGSNEAWTINVIYDNTTSTAIATVSSSASQRLWSNTGLSIAVVQGHFLEIQSVQPTWATNPAQVRWGGVIYIE